MQFRNFRLDAELPQRQVSLSELEDQGGGKASQRGPLR
jgi:hypothetical protein